MSWATGRVRGASSWTDDIEYLIKRTTERHSCDYFNFFLVAIASTPAARSCSLHTGAVLGPNSILKEDNFPGMLSGKVPQRIEGAPNFRRMSNMPVYGVGMPTVDGVIGVLK